MTTETKPTGYALVTGASRGIGRGIALELAEAGYAIGVHYNSSADGAKDVAGEIARRGGRAEIFAADLSDPSTARGLVEQFVAAFGRIDLLVNNAGVSQMRPFLDLPETMFDQIMAVNLKSPFLLAQAAARTMVEQRSGVIINISSNHSIGCWPGSTAYAASKAALGKLTKNMAMELSPHNIRVVCLAPGYTDVSTIGPDDSRYAERQATVGRISARIPGGRYATTTEIGKIAVFLASPAAAYMTGTTVFADGGALLPVVAQNEFT